MTRKLVIPLALVLLFAVVGCATINLGKPWEERTPQEKALTILDAYNAQYKNTMAMALNPNLTEAQKEVVRVKKATLTELWPLVDIYVTTVEAGGVPSPENEAAILRLIDRLVMLGG